MSEEITMGGDYMFTKMIPSLSVLLTLASCAGHQFQQPESIEAKMSRFEVKEQNSNIVPNLGFTSEGIEHTHTSTRGGRAPASVESASGEVAEEKMTTSNKKLYFMSLFSQYEKMRAFTPAGSTPDVNVCPSFHSGLVEWRQSHKALSNAKASKTIPFKYKTNKLADPSYVSMYPELSLPLSEEAQGPTVATLLQSRPEASVSLEGSRLLSQAIHQHASRLYKELGELCETGTSANYYNFENLLTHARNHRDLVPSEYALKVLMKTTVVSNMVLIESIESLASKSGRAPASVDVYTDEALDRLGTPWALDYLKSVIQKRDR